MQHWVPKQKIVELDIRTHTIGGKSNDSTTDWTTVTNGELILSLAAHPHQPTKEGYFI